MLLLKQQAHVCSLLFLQPKDLEDSGGPPPAHRNARTGHQGKSNRGDLKTGSQVKRPDFLGGP